MIKSYNCGIFILYATVCNLLRKLQISEDVPSLLGLVHRYCAGTKLVLASGTICKGNQKEFSDSWINKQTYRYTVYIWLFRFYICDYGSDSEKDYCCNTANNYSLYNYQGEKHSITIRLSHYLGRSTIVAVLITLHNTCTYQLPYMMQAMSDDSSHSFWRTFNSLTLNSNTPTPVSGALLTLVVEITICTTGHIWSRPNPHL